MWTPMTVFPWANPTTYLHLSESCISRMRPYEQGLEKIHLLGAAYPEYAEPTKFNCQATDSEAKQVRPLRNIVQRHQQSNRTANSLALIWCKPCQTLVHTDPVPTDLRTSPYAFLYGKIDALLESQCSIHIQLFNLLWEKCVVVYNALFAEFRYSEQETYSKACSWSKIPSCLYLLLLQNY